ncbi:MAG: class I SAM-dependent methyltransferase [Silicimonas sp.]|nr:class I SAM-dependent methyltransferase [Silicimonas sp.]RZW08533.1 MAG: class I SAM-dependent methyltransferase [Paracoccaceae bacterium]
MAGRTMQQVKRRRAVKGDSYYGKAAASYEKRRTQQGWWHEEHQQLENCLADLPRSLDVLDVPFGTGRFMPIYAARQDRVHGLDSSADMLSEATRLRGDEMNGCTTHVGSAMSLPFEDNSFDLLVSVRFLSEIITFADARKALADFARVTRSFAVLQLCETNDGQGQTPAEDAAMRDLMERADVDALLIDHGFNPIERFLVREDAEGVSRVHHILCKVG